MKIIQYLACKYLVGVSLVLPYPIQILYSNHKPIFAMVSNQWLSKSFALSSCTCLCEKASCQSGILSSINTCCEYFYLHKLMRYHLLAYWVTVGLFKSCPWEVAYCCFNFTKRTRQTRTMFVCIPSDTIEQMFLHFPGRLLMPKGTDRIPRSRCWNTILQSFCFSERRLSKRTSCITLQSEKITGTNQDCLCLLQPFCCLCNLQVFLKVQKWNETYDCLVNIDEKSIRNL